MQRDALVAAVKVLADIMASQQVVLELISQRLAEIDKRMAAALARGWDR